MLDKYRELLKAVDIVIENGLGSGDAGEGQ